MAEIAFYMSGGGLYVWDSETNRLVRDVPSGVGATDIATAPDGQIYAVTDSRLYKLDLANGSATFVGDLRGDLGLGDQIFTGANGFDIAPDGTAIVTSKTSPHIAQIDLTSGRIVTIGTLGDAQSAGDVVISGEDVFVSTTSGQLLRFQWEFGQLSEVSSLSTGLTRVEGLAGPFDEGGTIFALSGGDIYELTIGQDLIETTRITSFPVGQNFIVGATVLSGRSGPPPDDSPETWGTDRFLEYFGKYHSQALLALAAYHLEPREIEARRINDSNGAAENAFKKISRALDPLDDIDLPALAVETVANADFLTSGISNGIYTNGNAAMLLARSTDAIFIAFRGTNDNGKTGTPLVGPNTPDESHWAKKRDHYDLLKSALEAVRAYIDDPGNNIQRIYVTGHSLGGGMVEAFVDDFTDVTLVATTFAGSGYGLFDDAGESCLTNFRLDDDPITIPSYLSDNDGDMNVIFHNITEDVLAGGSLGNVSLHSMKLYAAFADFFDKAGIDFGREINGRDYDRFVAHENIGETGIQIGTAADVIVGTRRAEVIVGGEQDDSIRAGRGNDYVMGGEGADNIFGAGGRDMLVGGIGMDTFVFGLRSGRDRIVDFKDGEDQVDLQDFGIADYAALQLAGAVSADAVGTQIDLGLLGGSGVIILAGVDILQLGDDDFLF